MLAGILFFRWLLPELSTSYRPLEQLAQDFDAALASKDFEQANHIFGQIRRVAPPKDERVLLSEARLNIALNREARAHEILEKIPDSSPFAPMSRQLDGQVYLRSNRLVDAEKQLKEAVRLDPGNVSALRELIYIYGLQLRRQELRQVFEQLAKVAPMGFDNVFHWCLTRGNDWEPDEIVEDMTRFLAADPNDRWSRIALARSLKRLVRLDEAEQALNPLPEDDPDAAAIRAQIALDRNDTEKALAILSKSSQKHFDLAIMRAQMALAGGNFEESTREFQTAISIDPDNRDAVVGLARSLAAQGKKEEAKLWQERATNLDKLASIIQEAAKPNAAQVEDLPKRLAQACEAVGHMLEARAWWGLLAAKNPLDSEPQQAIYRIDQQLAAKKP
jgi:predicted Zn-dependent protease